MFVMFEVFWFLLVVVLGEVNSLSVHCVNSDCHRSIQISQNVTTGHLMVQSNADVPSPLINLLVVQGPATFLLNSVPSRDCSCELQFEGEQTLDCSKPLRLPHKINFRSNSTCYVFLKDFEGVGCLQFSMKVVELDIIASAKTRSVNPDPHQQSTATSSMTKRSPPRLHTSPPPRRGLTSIMKSGETLVCPAGVPLFDSTEQPPGESSFEVLQSQKAGEEGSTSITKTTKIAVSATVCGTAIVVGVSVLIFGRRDVQPKAMAVLDVNASFFDTGVTDVTESIFAS